MSPELIAALRANASAPKGNGWYGKPAPAKQKPRGRGGILSSLISELGGAGGAWGGAAAGATVGSAAGPVGTLLGGIAGGAIGGFTGGFAGRGVENKVRDDQNFLGAGGSAKTAAGEGLISGALGGAGKAYQAGRGLKAVGGLAGLSAATGGSKAATTAGAKTLLAGGKKAGASLAGGGADDLAKVAKLTGGRNFSERAGNSAYRSTLGVDDIVMPNNTKPTTIFKQDELTNAARRFGLKGNPVAMQRQAGVVYNRVNADVAKELAKSKSTVSYKKLVEEAMDKVSKELPETIDSSPVRNELGRTLNNILGPMAKKGKIDAAAINNFKTSLPVDSAFKKLAIGGNLTAKESADLALWSYTDDLITKLAPSAKALTKEQSNLYGIAQGLGRMTRTPGEPTSLVDVAARVAGPTVRRGQNAVGRGLMSVGGAQARAAEAIPGFVKPIAAGTITRGIANNMLMPQEPVAEDPQNQFGQETVSPDALYGDMGMGQMGMQEQAPQYTLQQALAEAYQLAPNASESELLSYAKALQDQYQSQAGAGGGELNVTKPTSEKYAQAKSGLEALDMFEGLIAQDPNVLARTRAPGRGIGTLGIGSTIKNATGTGEFDSLGFAAVDNMLRIATGAAAPESEIRRYMAQYLPEAGDNPATVKTKLDTMRRQFYSILDLANGQQTQQTNPLYDAIGNMGGEF